MRLPMFTSTSLLRCCALAVFASIVPFLSSTAHADQPRVKLHTNMGDVIIELEAERAPLTVANFLGYVKSGHFDGTIFHRVIQGFVVQGGGFTDKNVEKPTRAPIANEAGNGLSNRRGTVGLARTGDPHSGTSQFYINVGDNLALDPQPGRWGYAVFGRVIEGMDAVFKMSEVQTGTSGKFEDAPLKPIVIEKAEVLE